MYERAKRVKVLLHKDFEILKPSLFQVVILKLEEGDPSQKWPTRGGENWGGGRGRPKFPPKDPFRRGRGRGDRGRDRGTSRENSRGRGRGNFSLKY